MSVRTNNGPAVL